MADKKLTYILEVQSNGKIVATELSEKLKEVGEEGVKALTQITVSGKSSQEVLRQLLVGFNQLTQSAERFALAQKRVAESAASSAYPMTQQMKAQAEYWLNVHDRARKARMMYEEAYEANKKFDEALKKSVATTRTAVEETSNLTRTIERLQRTVVAFIGVWAIQKVISGFADMVRGGLEFNAVMEESRLGMASIFMAQGQFVTSTGKVLETQEALNAAMEMSSEFSRKLQLDNLKTAATYQQLVKAYQQTIAPGLAVGFSPDMIREYTVAMVQAASALGLNLDMLAEETRSMLRGAITPRNTLIATALGIRNEDIARYKGDVEGLYSYVMGRLSAFRIAGEAVQMTWRGAMSNLKDVIQIALGEGFTNLFDYLKGQALEIQKVMISWTGKGPVINPEAVAVFRSIGKAIIEIIEGAKALVSSFAGILPIIGSVYQLLRYWALALGPIISLFGIFLGFIGEGVRVFSTILEKINDTIHSSTKLTSIFGIIAAILLIIGSEYIALIPIIGTLSVKIGGIAASMFMWAPAVWITLAAIGATLAVANKLGETSKLLEVAFLALAAIMTYTFAPIYAAVIAGYALYELIKAIANANIGPIGAAEDPGASIEESMGNQLAIQKEIVSYKERAIQLDQKQKEELMGLVAATGMLTQLDRDRITKLNDEFNLFRDSIGDSKKEIQGLFDVADKLEQLGDIKFTIEPTDPFKNMDVSLSKILPKIIAFDEDIQDITIQEQIALSKLALAFETFSVPKLKMEGLDEGEIKRELAELSRLTVLKIRIPIEIETKNMELQIASQNKMYDEQKRLITEINEAKIAQMIVDKTGSDKLFDTMRRLADLQRKDVDIQRRTDILGWQEKINSADQYFAEMSGNLEEQVRLERENLEATFEKERLVGRLVSREQELSEEARRRKLFNEGERKLLQDRLNYESKILSLKSKIVDDIGAYELKARLTKEIYLNEMGALVAAGKISPARLEELTNLNAILSTYESRKILIQGENELTGKILDLQGQIAVATGDTAKAWDVQRGKMILALDTAKSLLAIQIEAATKTLNMPQGFIPANYEEDKKSLENLQAALAKIIELQGQLGKAQLKASPQEWIDMYAELENASDKWFEKRLEQIEEERKLNATKFNEQIAQELALQKAKYAQMGYIDMIVNKESERFDLENKYVNQTIGNAQKIFENASTLFDKESKEYQLMQNLKKAAQIAELVMEVRKNLAILSGLASVTSTSVASSATIVAGKTAEATVSGVAAIANQGSGDPYSAFARIAAMTAIMASVLAMAGIAFGGGGGGGAAPGSTALVRPPSGTVLGAEAGTGSDSVNRLLKLLENTYNMELDQLKGIKKAIDRLSNSIEGLVVSIIRSGITGMKTGALSTSFTGFGGSFQDLAGKYVSTWFNVMTLGILKGLGSKLGSWVSSGINWIFGGKTTANLTAFGLAISEISVAALAAGEALKVMGYQVIHFEKSRWFGSKKKWDEYSEFPLDREVTAFLTGVFNNMGKTLVELSKIFGTNINEAKNYIFDAFKIDLTGLTTAEEINEKLQEEFSRIGDIAVTNLFGTMIEKYQQAGEGLLETAVRLAQGLEAVKKILEKTNQQFTAIDTSGMSVMEQRRLGISTALGTVTEQMIDFSQALIEMAGGLDKLVEAASTYYDKFFTEAEKATDMQTDIIKAVNDLGFAMPPTREGYRDLMESLDLTTEAGMEAYVALLQLAEGADSVYTAQEKLVSDWKNLQIKLLELQGDIAGATAMRRGIELSEALPELRPLMEAIYAQEDYNDAVREVTDSQNDYNTAVKNTKQAMEDLEKVAEDLTKAQDDYKNAVRAAEDATRALEDAERSVPEAIRRWEDSVRGLEDAHRRYEDSILGIEDAHRAYEDSLRAVEDAHRAYEDSLRAIDDAHRAYEDSLLAIEDANRAYEDSLRNIVEAHKRYEDSLEAVEDALKGIEDAQKTYTDAIMELARLQQLIPLEQQYDALRAQFDAEAKARATAIEGIQDEQNYWRDQLSILSDQLRTQQDMVDNLKTISEDVKNWLTEMRTSSELAPVLSREAFEAEYSRLRSAATAPGAEPSAVQDFLSFGQKFLEFQRAYGGDYLTTFNDVLADMESIGNAADVQLTVAQQQLDATLAAQVTAEEQAETLSQLLEEAQAADEAAKETADAQLEAIQTQIDALNGIDDRLERAQEAIDNAAQGIIDAQERLIDAQYAVGDALRGIEDAERNALDALRGIEDAERNSADALQAISDAELASADALRAISDAERGVEDALRGIADAERESADALRGIGDAQREIEDALRGIEDAERGLLEAQEKLVESIQNEADALDRLNEAIEEYPAKLAAAQQALIDAQNAETMALDRLNSALERQTLASENLAAAMNRLATASVPGGLPTGSLPLPEYLTNPLLPRVTYPEPNIYNPYVGTQEPRVYEPRDYTGYNVRYIPDTGTYVPSVPTYPESWGVPDRATLPPEYDPTQDPNWAMLTNGGSSPMGFWMESPFYPYSHLYGYQAGGLAQSLGFVAERGPEWVVPTYEPERSRFLQNVPAAFWENLSRGQIGTDRETPVGIQEEYPPIHTHVYLDTREIAESVAKNIPRVASLHEAIKKVKGQ